MRIKSKFKDYYDFIAHQYGGGDPKVVYSRDRIAPLSESGTDIGVNLGRGRVRPLPYPYSSFTKYTFRWVAIAGKYYLIYSNQDSENFKVVTQGSEVYNLLKKERPYLTRRSENKEFIASPSSELIKLSRELKQPVFTLDLHLNGYRAMSTIPNLGELGFASLISPEQMYQDIAYFIGNTINESPDLAPPNHMTDKEKIAQHGFDLKQSFRHRK
jgi:hypothetical protein